MESLMKNRSQKLVKILLTSILALSVSGLSAMVYAEDMQQDTEVRIIANDGVNADVSIEVNGELTQLTLPKEVLHNPEMLEASIADLPKGKQELILKSLRDLPDLHGLQKHQHQQHVSTDAENEYFKRAKEDKTFKKIMIVEIDDEQGAKSTKKVIHKSIDGDQKHMIINDTGSDAEIIKHLIERGTFSSKEIDELIKALAAKR